MDPNIKNQNQTIPQTEKPDPAKDEKYAQALVAMANMEYKMEQSHIPQRKQLISKKKLIYIVVSIVVTILSLLLTPSLFKSGQGINSKGTETQLLDNAGEIKDLEK